MRELVQLHFVFRIAGSQYETHNVAWIAKIPGGGGFSTPIIVGDKIFVTSEWCSLSCFNKADGKLLWVRSPTYYDVATEEEKKAHPEIFQEIRAAGREVAADGRKPFRPASLRLKTG